MSKRVSELVPDAKELYLGVEDAFSKLVRKNADVAISQIAAILDKVMSPEQLTNGFHITPGVFFSEEENAAGSDVVKVVLSHVTDVVMNEFQERNWVICVLDCPKLTSEPTEHWKLSLFIKYIP